MNYSTDSSFNYHKIHDQKISFFSTPHLVIDNIFSADLAKAINEMWPKLGFQNEVKGNRILPITRHKYQNNIIENRHFWSFFNESIWPHLMSEITKKFEPYGVHIFGNLYNSHISLDHPLTLMEANEEYEGHDMHTHFYHAPHWAFTVLIYIDDMDTLSEGTTLHSLNPLNCDVNTSLSCIKSELRRSAEVAFDTFRWLDPNKEYINYTDHEVEYKFNRLFCFMDGPLSLHSVRKYSTIKDKIKLISQFKTRSRRRILRSHIKVHHSPFYNYYSNLLGEEISPEFFMKAMAFDPDLSTKELSLKKSTLFMLYQDMVRKHSELLSVNSSLKSYFNTPSSIFGNIKNVLLNKPTQEPVNRYLTAFLDKIP